MIVDLRERARAEGLWSLFLPGDVSGAGLTSWEYAMLCEDMGRSPGPVHKMMIAQLELNRFKPRDVAEAEPVSAGEGMTAAQPERAV